MALAEVTLQERMYVELRTRKYCDEMFGEDYFDEYAQEIPDALLKRFLENQQEFHRIQEEIRKLGLKP